MPDATFPPLPPADAAPAGMRPQPYPIVFTGSGREYFRVWIVNVLLTIVTLALYTPLARRRTAQYFYGHTLVAGTPLAFSASVQRMFLGFLVFLLLYAVMELTNQFGGRALRVLLSLAVVVLTPFFWGSAMRFRLRATRWRGVRMAFRASWMQVYRASWPLLLLLTVWLMGLELALYAVEQGLTHMRDEQPLPWTLSLIELMSSPWLWTALSLLIFILPLLVPLVLALQEFHYRRLLVRRAQVGQQAGYWAQPRRWPFIKAWYGAIPLALAGLAVVGVTLAFLIAGVLKPLGGPASSQGAEILITLLGAVLALALLWLALSPALAYHEATVFRTVWNEIGLGRVVRARCSLSVWGFVGLRLKHTLLSVLTLGFYRPFARAAEYRRKAESVTLYVKGDLAQLEGQLVREQGMLGDAVADAIGLDII